MADRLVFLRVLLKEIAKQKGLFATYMPKPTTGDWRSGAQHQLFRCSGSTIRGSISSGITLTVGPTPRTTQSAGLLRHGGALTALTATTVNSYNGLVPRVGGFEGGTVTWAPTHMTYGNNNRSAMLRACRRTASVSRTAHPTSA